MKINVSYEFEEEASFFLELLKPALPLFKIKRTEGNTKYKHIYLTTKKEYSKTDIGSGRK